MFLSLWLSSDIECNHTVHKNNIQTYYLLKHNKVSNLKILETSGGGDHTRKMINKTDMSGQFNENIKKQKYLPTIDIHG